jgi:hypothetical protein
LYILAISSTVLYRASETIKKFDAANPRPSAAGIDEVFGTDLAKIKPAQLSSLAVSPGGDITLPKQEVGSKAVYHTLSGFWRDRGISTTELIKRIQKILPYVSGEHAYQRDSSARMSNDDDVRVLGMSRFRWPAASKGKITDKTYRFILAAIYESARQKYLLPELFADLKNLADFRRNVISLLSPHCLALSVTSSGKRKGFYRFATTLSGEDTIPEFIDLCTIQAASQAVTEINLVSGQANKEATLKKLGQFLVNFPGFKYLDEQGKECFDPRCYMYSKLLIEVRHTFPFHFRQIRAKFNQFAMLLFVPVGWAKPRIIARQKVSPSRIHVWRIL